MTYKLYIGSNNKTGKLELSKIQTILNRYFEGYTIILGNGSYNGKNEQMALVEIATDEKELIFKAINALKKGIKQESIGMSIIPNIDFI
jgi:hypothetical protein